MSFVIPSHWVNRPSPHHKPRTKDVTAIILHADASANEEGTLAWLEDPDSGVSYHVLVGRKGKIYSIVHPDLQAYHAGKSELDGEKFCNGYSVGVSLANRNDNKEFYPPAQVEAALAVCALLCRHYGITLSRITTHAAVATPLGRKTDPLGLDVVKFRTSLAGLLR